MPRTDRYSVGLRVENARLRQKLLTAEKLAVMEECGIKFARNPAEMGKLLKSVLKIDAV